MSPPSADGGEWPVPLLDRDPEDRGALDRVGQ